VVDFLEKPIDVKRLRHDLRECLEPRGAQAQSTQGESRFPDAERGMINSRRPGVR
jgi:DNA-binding NtrC family response regulator